MTPAVSHTPRFTHINFTKQKVSPRVQRGSHTQRSRRRHVNVNAHVHVSAPRAPAQCGGATKAAPRRRHLPLGLGSNLAPNRPPPPRSHPPARPPPPLLHPGCGLLACPRCGRRRCRRRRRRRPPPQPHAPRSGRSSWSGKPEKEGVGVVRAGGGEAACSRQGVRVRVGGGLGQGASAALINWCAASVSCRNSTISIIVSASDLGAGMVSKESLARAVDTCARASTLRCVRACAAPACLRRVCCSLAACVCSRAPCSRAPCSRRARVLAPRRARARSCRAGVLAPRVHARAA